MNCFRKGTKIRSFIKLLLYILGFLLTAVSFTFFGLLLYPNLVGYCNGRISFEQKESEKQTNDHFIPSFSVILSGVGICKESSNNTLFETLALNESKIESPLEKENRTFMVDADLNPKVCTCANSSKNTGAFENDIIKENKTSGVESGTGNKCICNETGEIDDYETNKTRNGSENYDVDLLNSNETMQSDGLDHSNETNAANERYYLQSNICDCTKLLKDKNVHRNGTDIERLDASFEGNGTCECTEEVNVTFDADETTSVSEKQDYIPLQIRKCQCFKAQNGENIILNGSEQSSEHFDGVLSKDNECICPKILVDDGFNSDSSTRNTKNESKNDAMDSQNIGETIDEVNSQVNETEILNPIETTSETKESDVDSLNSEKCACSEIITNDSGIESNMSGVGVCICPETPMINDYNTTKGDGSLKNDEESLNDSDAFYTDDFYLNVTETLKETQSPEILEIDNFDIHETESTTEKSDVDSTNTKECVCQEEHKLLNNESKIESSKHGFKTELGDCVCPETLDLGDAYASETEPVSEKEVTVENENEAVNFKNFPISYELDKITEKESIDNAEKLENDDPDIHEGESTNEKSDVDSLNTKECVCPEMPELLNNGSKNESSRRGFETVDGDCVCPETFNLDDINTNETKPVIEKEQITDDENGTFNVTDFPNSYEVKTTPEKRWIKETEERAEDTELI